MAGKMLKFIRGKGQQPSAERQKLQNELFAFRKTVQHGFPNRPSALAWDPLLRLAAIGTSTGALKVYGQPGVEFYGQHSNSDSAVWQIHFIPGTGRLVSLCDDNSLHLWEINEKSLVELKSYIKEGKNKRISAACVESSGNNMLIGTDGGNLYTLDLTTFTVTEDVIYQEVVMQNCPEDFKVNPGAVECVCEHPKVPSRILIGYNRGLVVLWDRGSAAPSHTFVSNQQLESVCWSDEGDHFTSSHNDGSYVTWEVVGGGSRPLKEPVTPYGPYPCKAITKLYNRTSVDGADITIYAGGMPRASYADKYTVTVQQGEKHVAFDFTSRVVDLFTTAPVPEGSDNDPERPDCAARLLPSTVNQTAATLVVLAEEELVVIDLTDPSWRPIRPTCLVSLHASAVTAAYLAGRVDDQIFDTIVQAGLQQTENIYSESPWPISGGTVLEPPAGTESPERQLLLTGHEDGSVRFWDVSGVAMTPVYKYTTAQLFSGEDIAEQAEAGDAAEEEEWPPFRRVGIFDPYSDDPRLAVKKVVLCPLSGTLAVGGAAGQVVLATPHATPATHEIKSLSVNVVSDRDGFVWKGHDQLTLRTGAHTFPVGYQASMAAQLTPPAAVTAISLQPAWDALGVGTAHGLVLLDTRTGKAAVAKCTLRLEHTGAGDTPISRRKSFKKSLRESFRRLRKGRSQRRQTTAAAASPVQPKKPVEKAIAEAEAEVKPVERAVEARPTDDAFGSMVRCLYFANTHLVHSHSSTPTLWAGTNNGAVYAFTITVPPEARRKDEPLNCQLAKEIQLKHRAPVIGITILDVASAPLPDTLEVERGVRSAAEPGPQRVVITSEEQFKVFTLPQLKPHNKYKLTAHEGARVRRCGFAQFVSGSGTHSEWCLLCVTNLGDCLALATDLRRQLNAAALRKEDITGISSLCFSKRGEALYLHSSSELQRISLSATKVTVARCQVPLASWAAALRAPATAALNGEAKEETVEATTGHDVTAASADITVDSVRDHTNAAEPELNINLQNSQVNTSSMVVKTTTRTTLGDNDTTTTTTTTTTENILEHSREEGVITRIETGTVTVPAGTDPKLIMEMFDRQRSPLTVPVPPQPAETH